MNPARPSSGRADLPSSQLSTGEYVTLVVLLAAGIVIAAVFVTYAYQQRGLLAPARPAKPEHDGTDAPTA
jgi:hypothetical protein